MFYVSIGKEKGGNNDGVFWQLYYFIILKNLTVFFLKLMTMDEVTADGQVGTDRKAKRFAYLLKFVFGVSQSM